MYTFKKEERLCSRKMIDMLFSDGKVFMCYPFRVCYNEVKLESSFPVQVLFVVAKKRYKRANIRNLLKRRMRESYRLHKQVLYDSLNLNNKNIVLSISFISKEIIDFKQIDLQMKNLVGKLNTVLNTKTNESEETDK